MKPEDILRQLDQAGADKNKVWTPGGEQKPQEMGPLDAMAMAVQRCEMGIAHLSRDVMVTGAAADMALMTQQMFFDLLVENDIITKEELKERYKRDVVDKYDAMQKEAKAEQEAQMKAHYEEQMNDLNAVSKASDEIADAVKKDAGAGLEKE